MSRPRKPVEIKAVTANPGKRALPDVDQLAKVQGRPDPPADFGGRKDPGGQLLAAWIELTDNLAAAGVLGRENGAACEIYCRNLIRMRAAEANVLEHGPIVAAPRTGVPMHNPYLAVANKAAELVAKVGGELGLTPAARGKVSKVGAGEEDPDEAFFGAPPKAAGAAKPKAKTH